MTPKEKAQELVDKYVSLTDGWVYGIKNWEHKKKCALIAVNEIIELRKGYFDCTNPMNDESYWQKVKKEIENN